MARSCFGVESSTQSRLAWSATRHRLQDASPCQDLLFRGVCVFFFVLPLPQLHTATVQSGQENPVDPKINEHYLWHGCKPEACLCESSRSLGESGSGICNLLYATLSVHSQDMTRGHGSTFACDCSSSTLQRATAVLVPRRGRKAAWHTTATAAT